MACFVNLKGCNVGFKLVIFSGDKLSCISSNKLIKKISIKQKIQKEISRTTLLQQLSEQSIGLSSSSSRVWKRGSTKSGPMAASSQPTSSNFFFFTLSHYLSASSNSFLSISFPPFLFLYSSLLDSLSPVTLSSLLFSPFTLLSWTLTVSSNSLPFVFSLLFPYPSLLDFDYLQQLFLLYFFSVFFFFLLPFSLRL